MRQLVMAALALVAMSVVTAPSAMAQEAEKAAAEKKMEKAAKMENAAKAENMKWMMGTMTAPESDPVDIKYAFQKTDDGPMGWIVAENDEGETVKMEMRDLSWGDEGVTYNWSPPDQEELVITCSLMKHDDGSYGGDCTDNQEEGRTGQMTMAAMEKMDQTERMEKKEKKEKTDESAG